MSDTITPSIMEYTVDLNEVEAPEPLPVGEYPAEIVSAEIKHSGNTGNDYFAISFRIAPESYPADFVEGDPDGTVLQYNRLLASTKKVHMYRMKKFMLAVGGSLGRSLDPNDLVGLHGTVEVEHRPYEDEKQAAIKRVIAA